MSKGLGTVLVIGAAGFLGGYLVPALIEAGWNVRTLDKRDRRFEGAESFVGDVCIPDTLRPAMRGCDLVINLAAEHRDDVQPVTLYHDVNVIGARHVCEIAKECGIARQIFTSSVAVYGTQPSPMDEDTPHDYFNEYGRTKHLAELEYEAWRISEPTNRLVVVRPTVIFGPGNRGNVYTLLRQIKRGPFVMFGDGSNIKSMACVQNVAALICYLAKRNPAELVVNYADKPDFSMSELVAFVDRVLERNSSRPRLPAWLGLILGIGADGIAKVTRVRLPVSAIRVRKFMMRSEVAASRDRMHGFSPRVSMHEALREMVHDHV